VFVSGYAPVYGAAGITGTGQVGAAITADTGALIKRNEDAEWTYQWTKNGANIPGAIYQIYTIALEDYSSTINVKIGATSGATTISPSSGVFVGEYRPISGSAAINGIGRVGSVLTANSAGLDKEVTGDWTYQWTRDDGVIPGAVFQTYTAVFADYGTVLRVRIGSTKNSGTAASQGLAVDAYAVLSGSVSIAGTPKVGSGLTADISGLSWESSGSLTYQWEAGGVQVYSGPNNYYTVQAADLGKTIAVTVTGSRNEGSVVSMATAAAAPRDSTVTVGFSGMPAAQTIGFNVSPAVSLGWVANEALAVSVDTSAGRWASGASFQWHLDGPALPEETASQVTVYAGSLSLGMHTLSVKVTKGAESYSKTLVFTIVQ
jgi:hypothetical protein